MNKKETFNIFKKHNSFKVVITNYKTDDEIKKMIIEDLLKNNEDLTREIILNNLTETDTLIKVFNYVVFKNKFEKERITNKLPIIDLKDIIEYNDTEIKTKYATYTKI